MSDYLCIRITDSDLQPHSVLFWSVITSSHKLVDSGYTLLDQLQDELQTRLPDANIGRTIVIVPASTALVTEVVLPPGQRRHIKQVLPFVVEEQIIDPVESMHLVTPILMEGDAVPVVALSRRLLASWLDHLSEAGVLPDHMLLDAACVPQRNGQWQIMLDDHRVLFRSGRHRSTSIDESMVDSVLRLALQHQANEEHEKPSRGTGEVEDQSSEAEEGNQPAGPDGILIDLVVADEVDSQAFIEVTNRSKQRAANELQGSEVDLREFANGPDKPDAAEVNQDEQASPAVGLDDLPTLESTDSDAEKPAETARAIELSERVDRIDRLIRSENFNTERTHYSETASELLAISAIQNLDASLNILQGDFRPANANAQNRRVIRRVSVAMAACLGLFLVVSLGGGYYLNWQADSYFDKSVAIYRGIFPKQRKVLDPVKQMKRQLSGQAVGSTTSEFLPLLDAASRSLVTLEERSSVEADIKQLRYDVQRGNIAIDINASNIDELEAYKELLVAEGLSVDILSANQDGDIVKGRLQIGRS